MQIPAGLITALVRGLTPPSQSAEGEAMHGRYILPMNAQLMPTSHGIHLIKPVPVGSAPIPAPLSITINQHSLHDGDHYGKQPYRRAPGHIHHHPAHHKAASPRHHQHQQRRRRRHHQNQNPPHHPHLHHRSGPVIVVMPATRPAPTAVRHVIISHPTVGGQQSPPLPPQPHYIFLPSPSTPPAQPTSIMYPPVIVVQSPPAPTVARDASPPKAEHQQQNPTPPPHPRPRPHHHPLSERQEKVGTPYEASPMPRTPPASVDWNFQGYNHKCKFITKKISFRKDPNHHGIQVKIVQAIACEHAKESEHFPLNPKLPAEEADEGEERVKKAAPPSKPLAPKKPTGKKPKPTKAQKKALKTGKALKKAHKKALKKTSKTQKKAHKKSKKAQKKSKKAQKKAQKKSKKAQKKAQKKSKKAQKKAQKKAKKAQKKTKKK